MKRRVFKPGLVCGVFVFLLVSSNFILQMNFAKKKKIPRLHKHFRRSRKTETFCDNTWKALAPRTTSTHEVSLSLPFEHLFVVISHCDASLAWLDHFLHGFEIEEIVIISKCGKTVQGMPEMAEVVRIPNVGRCDHTYALWMAQLIEDGGDSFSDNDLILFLKDTAYDHMLGDGQQELRDMLRTVSARGFACFQLPPKHHSTYHETNTLRNFGMKKYVRLSRDTEIGFRSEFATMDDWVKAMGFAFNQSLTPVCYQGNFATTVAQIRNRGSVWTNIESSLSRGDNIEEGHFAERSWAALLSSYIEDRTIAALRDASGRVCNVESDKASGWWGPLCGGCNVG